MDMTVSETILKQLGGYGRLKCMVGAYNFLTSDGRDVSFRFKMCKK